MRIIVLVAALGLAAACERGSSDQGPETSAPAGKVVDIEGTVRARPVQGEARVLALGDEVSGAEIIETGAGGSVQIALYHNDAQWFLGPDKQRQVNESEAWRLPRQPRQPLLAVTGEVDPTAAAGRQAERLAADTLATARAEVGEQRAAVPDERANVADEAMDDVADKAASTPVQRRVTRSREPKKPKQSSSSTDSSDPGTFMREQPVAGAPVTEATEGGAAAADHGPPTGAAGKSAQRPASAPESEAVSLEPPASPAIQLGATNLGKDADAAALRAVRAAIQKRLPRVVQCLGGHKPAESSAVVSFALTPEGRTSSLEISVKDEVLRGCLTKHWRPLHIPGVAAGTKVEQTLVLVGF